MRMMIPKRVNIKFTAKTPAQPSSRKRMSDQVVLHIPGQKRQKILFSSVTSSSSIVSKVQEVKISISNLHATTTANSDEYCNPIKKMDEQSQKKALRAAMLKSRFADIIAKANGGKVDQKKMQQEKELLENMQREELKLKEEKLKLERQAARIALEKMTRTVVVEDNMKALRELQILAQCSSADFFQAFGVGNPKRRAPVQRPLELLGLYLKP